MIYAREQALKCSGDEQFCSFFYAFEIQEGSKEGYLKVGESEARLNYGRVNKIICFPEGGYTYFKGMLT